MLKENMDANYEIFVNVTEQFIGIVTKNLSTKEWMLKWSEIWRTDIT